MGVVLGIGVGVAGHLGGRCRLLDVEEVGYAVGIVEVVKV